MQNKQKNPSTLNSLINLKSHPFFKLTATVILIASLGWIAKDFFDGFRDYFNSKNMEILSEIKKEHRERFIELQNQRQCAMTGISSNGVLPIDLTTKHIPDKENIASLDKAIEEEIKSYEISIRPFQ